jgi:AcrR family transcriptional regulator
VRDAHDQNAEESGVRGQRRPRADARRNLDALLQAAKAVFADSGVDAPIREIAETAGVGVGTVYRHFPQRSDLIKAVFRREIDACAEAAPALLSKHDPADALALWMQRFVDFIATKRGLAAALHSGDPAYQSLPAYFDERLQPAFQSLLDAAAASGAVRPDIDAKELLYAVASLSVSAHGESLDQSRRMVALLVDGLRYGASSPKGVS